MTERTGERRAIDVSIYTFQKHFTFATPTMFLVISQVYLHINHIVYK